MSMRHCQGGKTHGKSKDTHHKEDKKENESYGPRSLKWTTEKKTLRRGAGNSVKLAIDTSLTSALK